MTATAQQLRERIQEVHGEIAAAARKSGRSEADVTLVAVSKTFPAETLREAYAAGLRDFGENRVQEIAEKGPRLEDLDLHLHMIGHLQTNKVRTVLPHIACLHSLDRARLADELTRRMPEGRTLPVLLQVNTTGEETKSGVEPGDTESLLESVRGHAGLEVRGLMTIGPLGGTHDENRRAFATLRELRDEIAERTGLPLPWLSMGMSLDFPIAIEEGATHVRVGSRIFGTRTQK